MADSWDRKEIQQAHFSWKAVADSGVLTETDPGQQRMAEGYRDALEMVLRNVPRFTTVGELGAYFGARYGRQLTPAEADLLLDLADAFHIYPKVIPG